MHAEQGCRSTDGTLMSLCDLHETCSGYLKTQPPRRLSGEFSLRAFLLFASKEMRKSVAADKPLICGYSTAILLRFIKPLTVQYGNTEIARGRTAANTFCCIIPLSLFSSSAGRGGLRGWGHILRADTWVCPYNTRIFFLQDKILLHNEAVMADPSSDGNKSLIQNEQTAQWGVHGCTKKVFMPLRTTFRRVS